MECVSTYILLVENDLEPTKPNFRKVLDAVDADVSEESLDYFLSLIDGRTFSEIFNSGSELLKTRIPSASDSKAVDQSSAKVEEEAPQESSSSSGVDMDFF